MTGSSVIGALRVNLGLDTAQFSTGIKQAQTRLSAFASDLNKRLGKLGDLPGIRSLQNALGSIGANAGAALGVAAATSATALGAMSISAINTAHELQNLSRLANATPEEFQRMAYAAERVGISQEKFSDILKDVNDRIGDFVATGGGPMKDFFERIAPKVGVTAEHFRNLSGPQALQLYVKSLEDANLNQQDFTFFMEAMASDSTALVPILQAGGAQAKAYGDRLAALGGVMSNQTVARLASMKTALSEVGIVMTGLKNTLGAAFAPLLTGLASSFTSLFTTGSALRVVIDGLATGVGWLASVLAAVLNIVGSAIAAVWQLVSGFASWLNQITGVGDAIKTIWDWTFGWIGDILIGTSDVISAVGGISGAFWALVDIGVEVWSRIKAGLVMIEEAFTAAGFTIAAGFTAGFALILRGFASLTSGIARGWNSLMNSMGLKGNATGIGEGLASTVEGLADGYLEQARESWDAAASAYSAATAPLKSLEELNRKVAEQAVAAGDALGEGGLSKGLDLLNDKTGGKGGAKEKLSELQKVMKALREEAQLLAATMGMTDLEADIWAKQREAGVSAGSEAGQQINTTMRSIDGMKRLKDATEEWRDSIKSAFSEFILQGGSFKQVISQIIAKLAEMVLSAGFDALWGSIGGNGLVGGLLSGMGIGGNANGTRNWRGGLSRVNERGGEIMNLPRGTQVIPHDISKRMADRSAGGGRLDVHVTAAFDESGNLYVKQVAQQEAATMGQAINSALPARVQQINQRPRKR